MKKFLRYTTAICAVMTTMFMVYCLNPDFDNPLDPKNSGSSGGGGGSLVLPSGYAWVNNNEIGNRYGYLFRSDGTVQFIGDNYDQGTWTVLYEGTWSVSGIELTTTIVENTRTVPFSITNTTLRWGDDIYTKTAISFDSGWQSSLSQPQNVTATATTSTSITVSWSPVSGAKGYYVYRGTVDGALVFTQVGDTQSTSWTDTGLRPKTPYYHQVVAYNDAGTSLPSNSVITATP